ncbi:MAG: helix-turn-helix domain-containing protein [Streptomyces turgidiscabies]|nr:helix-turn-helix domain-containing protein [Streptomyces turgidiscabies]
MLWRVRSVAVQTGAEAKGDTLPAGGKPTVRSRRLGATLRQYRLAARLDQEHAAEALGCSKAKISRVETGISAARVGDVRVLLDLYEVEDRNVYMKLEQLARDSNKRGWWLKYPQVSNKEWYADFVSLEADASYIRTYHPVFIPGLLQTGDYLRTLVSSGPTVHPPEVIDEMVAVRQTRRQIIKEGGAQYAAVIWEPALTAPMPSSKIHRDQLLHILDVAQRQNVSIQVLPFSAWQAAHLAPYFVMFSFGPEPAPEAVAYDTTTTTMILEDLEEMAYHARVFEYLRSAALPPDQSLDFIRKAIEKIPASEKEA